MNIRIIDGLKSNKTVYAVFLLALLFRLYRIDNPLLDFHSWRQTDTATIARNLLLDNFDILRPRLNIFPFILPIEFQLYTFIVALFYKIFGLYEIFGRVVSVCFGLGAMAYLYLIAKRHYGRLAAFFSILFYSFLPMMVHYSRNFMPDISMVFFTLGGVYYCLKYSETLKLPDYLLCGLFLSAALLIKISAFYILLPVSCLFYHMYGSRFIYNPKYLLLLVIIILPPAVWYYYTNQAFMLKTGINMITGRQDLYLNMNWLLNTDFWQKIILTRIFELMFAYTGGLFLLRGLLIKPSEKKEYFFYFWLAGVILSYIVFAGAVYHHEHWQITVIPVGVIFIGKALSDFFQNHIRDTYWRDYRFYLIILLVAFVPVYSILKIRSRTTVHNMSYILLSEKIKIITDERELLLIYDYGNPEVAYYSWRKGHHISSVNIEDIEVYRRKGCRYFVTVFSDFEMKDREVYDYLLSRYVKKYAGPEGYIFSLY